MDPRRISRVAAGLAVGFFVAVSLISLAGADWPPPRRFGLLLLAFAVLAGVLQQRLRCLLIRHLQKPGGGMAIAAREGGLAGLALGLSLLAIGGGEPSLPPSVSNTILSLSALGITGTLGAIGLWSLALLACHRQGP
jgi:drug/metabolite transporter (DMT)-like permease